MFNRMKTVPVFIILIVLLIGCGQPAITPSPIPILPTTTPAATATTDPAALRFIEIPEQTTLQGETFLPLDTYNYLRYRRSAADKMTWIVTGSEHIATTIANGVIKANPTDAAWYGSEMVQVEACEPGGNCVKQTIVFNVMDKTSFNGARVTYVGNSGFLVMVGDKKVLIDAMFAGFPSEYTLPAEEQDLLVNAEPPFDNLDLILATHDHADHFDAAIVRQHMQNDPNTIFISTTQAVSQLADLGDRVIAADPVAGSPVTLEANGIQVEAIYLSHGAVANPADEIFNNGYVVTVNGIKFFHTGDIGNLNIVHQYHLADQKIDLAFIPNFFMQDDHLGSVIYGDIGAKYIFPIHYQYTTPAFNASQIIAYYPEAIIFSSEMENWFMPATDNK
jgi:L-ascorbate metabolism protein UlaG (beta-lactamase superfamily)